MAKDKPWIPEPHQRKQLRRELDTALTSDLTMLIERARHNPDSHDDQEH